MNVSKLVIFKIFVALVGIVLVSYFYLLMTFEPGFTVFIEDTERRDLLKKCLLEAGATFELTSQGSIKAKADSIDITQRVWNEFEGYRNPSLEKCSELR